MVKKIVYNNLKAKYKIVKIDEKILENIKKI